MDSVGRVGLVLVVKDEVHDIAGWLAWHATLGFDTIFVFDDRSTDGTDQIVRSAAGAFDVRYAPVVQDRDGFYDRQQNEYVKLLAAMQGEFAWLCFLDGDEYLMLNRHDSVHEFLAGYPDAHAIGVNWRLHGGKRMLRPMLPAPLAYPQHSGVQEGINKHVKSFVRPDRQTGMVNVHCFKVDAAHYVDTDNRPVRWHVPGIISGRPLWDTALVLHFQNRSMEHFLERVRKRHDIQVDVRNWTQEEWDREYDPGPNRFASRLSEALLRIEAQTNAELCRLARSQIRRRRPSLWQAPAPEPTPLEAGPVRRTPLLALRRFALRTHFDTSLQVETASNLLVHATAERAGRGGLQPAILVGRGDDRTAMLLVRQTEANRPLRLDETRQAMVVLPLELADGEAGQVKVLADTTGLYLTAEPPRPDGLGQIRANRRQAKEWEHYRLEALDDDLPFAEPVRDLLDGWFSLPAEGLTADLIATWLVFHPVAVTAALLRPVLRRLPANERVRFAASLAETIAPDLITGSQYS